MSDIREEFEKWVNANQGYTYWDVWQAAHARYGTTDRSRWRVDDLVQNVDGDIFTIDGVKGNKLLVKDASENLWLTPADELSWHSRAQKNA